MTEDEKEMHARMERAVRLRRERRDRWRREGERPLWKNMSMVGALGWLIVAPTLAGVVVGRWLDGLMESGVTFTGALVLAGAGVGLALAWRRMNQE